MEAKATTKGNAKTTRKANKKEKAKMEIVTEKVGEPIEESFVEENDMFENPEGVEEVDGKDLDIVAQDAALQAQDMQMILPDDLQDIDLRGRVVDLRKEIDGSRFEIGRVLYYAKVNESWKGWGFDSFDQYVASEEAGAKRTVHALIQIHGWFINDVKDDAKVNQIKTLGWSKAEQLMSLDKSKDPDEKESSRQQWIDDAQDLNLKNLTEQVRQQKVIDKEGEDADVTKPVDLDESHPMKFKFYGEKYTVVSEALKAAGKASDCKDDSQNLFWICQQYLADGDAGQDFKGSREKILERIEEQLKVKIVALDSDTNEAVFGASLLEG